MSKGISPEIHFKGYTDTWEQRKLGDLAEIIGGGTPDTNNPAYWDGDIDWYAPAEMEGQRYASSSVRKITELGLQKSSAKVLPAYKTVLFTSRAGIGKMAILQRPAATNQGFQSLVLRDGTDPYFIYAMGDKIKNMAEGVASGSTFLEISGKMLGNLEVMIPTLNEQKEIASFFRGIDDLITLHQRKYTKLKNYKSAIANKIFPAIGQQPVLRIINKEPWKEVPLSEIGDYFSTDSLGYADLIEDGKYKCLLYGDLYTKYNEIVINVKSSTDKLVTKLFKGDILFPTSTTVDALSLIAPSSVCEDDVYTGGDLFGIRPKVGVNGTFVSYYINNKHSLKNSLSKNAQGLTIVHIHYDNIKDEKIMLPEYDEQIAIVSLFTALDNLIESENNYINKLKIIKQAFLSKMFVEVEA